MGVWRRGGDVVVSCSFVMPARFRVGALCLGRGVCGGFGSEGDGVRRVEGREVKAQDTRVSRMMG